jgi:hypothetical protein
MAEFALAVRTACTPATAYMMDSRLRTHGRAREARQEEVGRGARVVVDDVLISVSAVVAAAWLVWFAMLFADVGTLLAASLVGAA